MPEVGIAMNRFTRATSSLTETRSNRRMQDLRLEVAMEEIKDSEEEEEDELAVELREEGELLRLENVQLEDVSMFKGLVPHQDMDQKIRNRLIQMARTAINVQDVFVTGATLDDFEQRYGPKKYVVSNELRQMKSSSDVNVKSYGDFRNVHMYLESMRKNRNAKMAMWSKRNETTFGMNYDEIPKYSIIVNQSIKYGQSRLTERELKVESEYRDVKFLSIVKLVEEKLKVIPSEQYESGCAYYNSLSKGSRIVLMTFNENNVDLPMKVILIINEIEGNIVKASALTAMDVSLEAKQIQGSFLYRSRFFKNEGEFVGERFPGVFEHTGLKGDEICLWNGQILWMESDKMEVRGFDTKIYNRGIELEHVTEETRFQAKKWWKENISSNLREIGRYFSYCQTSKGNVVYDPIGCLSRLLLAQNHYSVYVFRNLDLDLRPVNEYNLNLLLPPFIEGGVFVHTQCEPFSSIYLFSFHEELKRCIKTVTDEKGNKSITGEHLPIGLKVERRKKSVLVTHNNAFSISSLKRSVNLGFVPVTLLQSPGGLIVDDSNIVDFMTDYFENGDKPIIARYESTVWLGVKTQDESGCVVLKTTFRPSTYKRRILCMNFSSSRKYIKNPLSYALFSTIKELQGIGLY